MGHYLPSWFIRSVGTLIPILRNVSYRFPVCLSIRAISCKSVSTLITEHSAAGNDVLYWIMNKTRLWAGWFPRLHYRIYMATPGDHAIWLCKYKPLQWRHNGHDSVSNHQPHDCLLNRLFRRRSKKISKLRVTGLCAGNSPGTAEFPGQ